MNDLSEIYQRIAPELMKIVEERYLLLTHISYAHPVGRRILAMLSKLSERVVRSHVEIMKDNGLIEFTQQGMILSKEGEELLPILSASLHELNKISELEQNICNALQLDRVIISSSGQERETILKDLGYRASKVLQEIIKPGQIMAVSGGSTMAAVAEALPTKNLPITIIPARGGIGERVEYQANVISSVIAEKFHGTYKMLHLPDGLSEESLRILTEMEPQIKEILMLSKQTNIMMFGIGEAMHMAEQRHISLEQRQKLKEEHAVGESLGQYCAIDGRIVYATNNVGISLSHIETIDHVVAVAGGKHKARAIIGVMRACKKGTLIIDESAAEEIAKLLSIL